MGDDERTGRAAARQARAAAGIAPDAPLGDLLTVVEDDLGRPVAGLDLGERLAGAYLRPPGLDGVIVVSRSAHVRQRFTIAHELGHHCLGHRPGVDDLSSPYDRTDPAEVQATAFAGEFLVAAPQLARMLEEDEDPDVRRLDTVARLACRAGISTQAMRHRLTDCGHLVDGGDIARLDAELRDELHMTLGFEMPEDRVKAELSVDHLPRIPAALEGTRFAELARAGELGLG